jgi:hypothetical protein
MYGRPASCRTAPIRASRSSNIEDFGDVDIDFDPIQWFLKREHSKCTGFEEKGFKDAKVSLEIRPVLAGHRMLE